MKQNYPNVDTLDSFRFYDEDDYDNGIFSILGSARGQTNVILVGKCGSRRQSTTRLDRKAPPQSTVKYYLA